jgi:hypothetical protein
VLSRYGAKILLMPELIPEQEVTVYCPETRKDRDARVVGLLTKELEGFTYGIEFLDQEVNFWDVAFPPPPGPQGGAPADAIPSKRVPPASSREVASRSEGSRQAASWGPGRKAQQEEAPQAAATRSYAVRLQCPYGDQDQWVTLRDRSEPLQQILETRWDFECSMHGAQVEFPLDVRETPVAVSPWSAEGKSHGSVQARARNPEPFAPSPSRKEPRLRQRRRVWVRGSDRKGNTFLQSASSVDISRNGARLDGVGLLIRPGATLEVKCGWKKALFRVVWTGAPGTSQANEVGICCLEPEKNIWNIP